MKTRYTLAILTLGMSLSAMAQEVDDMYFTSRDRAVVNAAAQISLTKKYQQEDLMAVRSNPVNPSDSYSGRGINPEYTAQSKKGMAVVQENPDYFLPTYQPKNVNKSLYNGSASSYSCNCNSAYGNPYYSGMGYGGFGSPYSMYSPYGSMYSPYGGMNMSMGYGMGSMYGSSMYYGMSYGMGSMYGMGGMGSMFGMGYGMGSMYGMGGMGMYGYNPYYGYGYPGNVVVVPADVNGTAYGRHSSRSTSLNNYVDNTRGTAANTGAIAGTNGRTRDGSRMSSTQSNYYDPSWRNNSSNFPARSSYDNNNSGFTRSGNSAWGNGGFDNGSRTRSSFDNMGGSRSSFGGGGFSGGGSSGGGGGGHSRGRN